ncbi:MAG: PEP-CTERM sorting domain-containing protein [Rariglobus sp.]
MLLPVFATFVASVGAVEVPYSNDFSGTGGNVAFANETLDANWTVSNGQYVHSINTGTTTAVARAATIQLTNTPAAFSMSTEFTVTASSASSATQGATYGLAAFGAEPTLAGTSVTSSYYLADLSYGATTTLRIVKVNGSNATLVSVSDAAYKITLGTTYSLKLNVLQSAGSVSMTFGLYDTNNNLIGSSVTGTDSSSPLSGDYFGLRNRYQANTTFTTSYDNFNITPIPEPSTLAMLAGGLAMGVAMVSRRARRS